MILERVGVYVDHGAIEGGSFSGMDFSALRRFSLRGGSQGAHLNVYAISYSVENETDYERTNRLLQHQSQLRSSGFNLQISLKQASDELLAKSGHECMGVQICVDMMEAARLDRVVIVSNDGNFAPLVAAVRRKGARVELIGGDGCHHNLRASVDTVLPFWIVPGLLPVSPSSPEAWGAKGSRIRGIIESIDKEMCMGMVRYMPSLEFYADFGGLAPMTHEIMGHAIIPLDDLISGDPETLKGSIVEFTMESVEEYIAEGAEVKIIRKASPSGWFAHPSV